MKIFAITYKDGKIACTYKIHDHCDLFRRLEQWGHTFITQPDSDPYYIFFLHGTRWSTVDQSPEACQLLDQFKKDLQSKHATLVILSMESCGILKTANNGFGNPTQWVKNSSDFFDIPVGDIIYSDTGFRIEHALKAKGIKAFWFDWFQNYITPDPLVSDAARRSIIDRTQRSKKFLYFGGVSLHRSHRLEFLTRVDEQCQFRSISYYSNAPGSFYDCRANQVVYVPGKVLDLPEINQLNARITNNTGKTLYHEFHLDSYINVVANSYFAFNPGRLELNEKLYKPMLCMQPFINLGEVGTLQALRSLGYKTFDRWFDEKYDTLGDEQERMEAVLAEVTRLSQMSNSELNDMLVDMLPVLEHNYNLVSERYHTDQGFHDFVSRLEEYRNLIISG